MTDHGFWAKSPFHYITGRVVVIIMNDHCCVGCEDLVEAVLGGPLPCSAGLSPAPRASPLLLLDLHSSSHFSSFTPWREATRSSPHSRGKKEGV